MNTNNREVDEMYEKSGKINIFWFENGASNICGLELDDEIVVFDSSLYSKKFEEAIDILQDKYNKKVKKVFLTHYHPDHSFGVIFSKNNLELFMNMETFYCLNSIKKESLKSLSDNSGSDFMNLQQLLTKKKVELFNGNILKSFRNTILNGISVGGHSKDSTIYIIKPDNILISGDLVFSKVHAETQGANIDIWKDLLCKLDTYDIAYVVPGHGTPSGKELLKVQFQYLQDYSNKEKLKKLYSTYLLSDLLKDFEK